MIAKHLQNLLVVTGPTACGKSALAISLAKKFDGEIVSCDSVQIYKELNIGSAKVSESEQKEVPHHLIDILNPEYKFSVAAYVEKANSIIQDIQKRNKIAIVCGGTTLYLTHLLHGLAPLPPSNEMIRKRLESFSSEDLMSQLQFVDPEMAAKLHVHDRNRVIRALETFEQSGKPASKLQAEHSYEIEGKKSALMLVLCAPRNILVDRISERTTKMVSAGLVEEVRGLIFKYGRNIPALDAVGYSEARDLIEGKLAEKDLILSISRATSRYAKRQMTYFRNEPRKRNWLVRPSEMESGYIISDESSTEGRRTLSQPMRVFDWNFSNICSYIEQKSTAILETTEVNFLQFRK